MSGDLLAGRSLLVLKGRARVREGVVMLSK
jgi:hypothetical protein